MSKNTILYIDDEITHTHQFERGLSDDFEIQTIDFNNLTEEVLASRLDERSFDYLIVDYHLHEKSNCGFNGDKVVVEFSRKYPHFPVMLLTNYDNQAITNIVGFDLEKIHSKHEYTDEHLKDAFVKRINRKVKEYRELIKNAEEKIELLIKKKADGEVLDALEEEEIIELDSFLDEILDGESKKIPDQIKETNEEKISSLLDKTDKLITKLEEYEGV